MKEWATECATHIFPSKNRNSRTLKNWQTPLLPPKKKKEKIGKPPSPQKKEKIGKLTQKIGKKLANPPKNIGKSTQKKEKNGKPTPKKKEKNGKPTQKKLANPPKKKRKNGKPTQKKRKQLANPRKKKGNNWQTHAKKKEKIGKPTQKKKEKLANCSHSSDMLCGSTNNVSCVCAWATHSLPSRAPVDCGCPAGTHRCVTMSRVTS